MSFKRMLCGALLALVPALAIVLRPGTPGAVGCTTHQCDPDIVCIDGNGNSTTVSDAGLCGPATGGTPVAHYNLAVQFNGRAFTWTTTTLSGPWLDFPGNRTYVISLPQQLIDLGATLSIPPKVYVSADNPSDAAPHMNLTVASGALAEFENVMSTQFSVLNATCAGYSLLVEVDGTLDGFGPDGFGPDAGGTEASLDAHADVQTETSTDAEAGP
jgi:hypothetical protein